MNELPHSNTIHTVAMPTLQSANYYADSPEKAKPPESSKSLNPIIVLHYQYDLPSKLRLNKQTSCSRYYLTTPFEKKLNEPPDLMLYFSVFGPANRILLFTDIVAIS